tara:strand:- start:116 stop:742 length:627 start_codon:yes stop_codon:yes gene_type:complete
MKLFNFLRKKDNKFSQSGQDQFAYNISGSNGTYLEIGAHHPVINSNTFNLEVKCNWNGISVEYDKSFQISWGDNKLRKNNVVWDDAFNINYSSLIKQRELPNRLNYLSCDIEPAENTFNILKKVISSELNFDFISFEHDKYSIGNKYEDLSIEYLKNYNYKVAVKDVYSRNKRYKIYETWFVNNDIDFEEMDYSVWKEEHYKSSKFNL